MRNRRRRGFSCRRCDKLPEGATIEACEGGMRAHEIAEDDLQPGIRTVAAAIVALTDAQFAGAACIRL